MDGQTTSQAATPPVRLKALLRERHWQTHRTFTAEYNKAARRVDLSLVGTGPSRAQLHRWTAGEIKTLPYSDHCRVLEQMFGGWSAAQLFERVAAADPQPQPAPALPASSAQQRNPLHDRGDPSASGLGSVSEPADRMPVHRVDLSSDWQACWQSQKAGVEDIRIQPVRMRQRGERIQVEALARGRPVEEGGYLWRGEFRLWDNETLMGWYAATDGSVRSKGTMYFILHPHGINMTGRWVGLSYDGRIVTGWSSMAKSADEARELVAKLKESGSG